MWIIPLLWTAGLVGVVVVVVMAAKSEVKRKVAHIDLLAHKLRGVAAGDRSSCTGDFEGTPIVHAMASRSCGSSSETWTEVSTKLSSTHALALRVRPKRTPGMVPTMTTGDEGFDARYVVEGAPVAPSRLVLTPALRAFMCTHPACELDCDGERVKLSARGWVDDAADAELAWRALASVRLALAVSRGGANDEREIAALGVMRANAVPSNMSLVAVMIAMFVMILVGAAVSAWSSVSP